MPIALFSAGLDVKFVETAESNSPNVFVSTDEAEAIVKNIDMGFTSEIDYNFRYRKKDTFFMFPEKKVDALKSQIIYKAKKDFLTGYYIIDDGSETYLYDNKEKFLSAFFSCDIPGFGIIDFSKTIVEVKVTTDVIVRPPPLSLLETFIISEKQISGWIRYDK